jgi:hypothetical protein
MLAGTGHDQRTAETCIIRDSARIAVRLSYIAVGKGFLPSIDKQLDAVDLVCGDFAGSLPLSDCFVPNLYKARGDDIRTNIGEDRSGAILTEPPFNPKGEAAASGHFDRYHRKQEG